MTAATITRPACRCGHNHGEHTRPDLAPQCVANGCTCLQYRPPLGTVSRQPAAAAATQPIGRERCSCGHGRKPHEIAGFQPACAVDGCTCTTFTTGSKPATPAPSEPSADDVEPAPPAAVVDAEPAAPEYTEPADEDLTIEQLLDRGRASELAPIVKLTDKIGELIDDLRERLADEAAAAGVKRLVADLEAQLAAAKDQLRSVATGRRKTPPDTSASTPPVTADGHACTRDGCERTFATTQARALHERRAHDGFNPGAPKAG